MITLNIYYTYAYLREDGTPYYIGKGKGNRAYHDNGARRVKMPPRERILILKKNLTEEEAFRHEVYMIAVLGRKDLGTGILRNMCNGGEGSAGHKMSEEERKIRSERLLGEGNPMYNVKPKSASMKWYNLDDEVEKMFVPGEQPDGWKLGRKSVSEETRKKHSERQKQKTGWKHKPETIEKLRGKARNRAPVSEETKAKMSAAHRGKPGRKHKPETIEKLRERARNRPPVSEETRAKMRAGQASYQARRGR